jgi:hypothetical protein
MLIVRDIDEGSLIFVLSLLATASNVHYIVHLAGLDSSHADKSITSVDVDVFLAPHSFYSPLISLHPLHSSLLLSSHSVLSILLFSSHLTPSSPFFSSPLISLHPLHSSLLLSSHHFLLHFPSLHPFKKQCSIILNTTDSLNAFPLQL